MVEMIELQCQGTSRFTFSTCGLIHIHDYSCTPTRIFELSRIKRFVQTKSKIKRLQIFDEIPKILTLNLENSYDKNHVSQVD